MSVAGNISSVRTARELVAAIEQAISAGLLRPGERLDPVRVMAADLGLAANTVAAAYRTLGERGLVRGEGRRGTFVAQQPSIAVSIDERVPAGLIDLSSGNPDPGLLPDLAPVLTTISPRHTLYGEPSGDPALVELLRADLAADGVDAEHLCIVSGALDGIERILAAHTRPGDEIGIEDPGYPAVIELVAAMGLRRRAIAVDRHGPNPDSVAAALRSGVTAVIITPRAQNPTGAALNSERATQLRSTFESFPDVLIVEDDHAWRVAGVSYRSAVGRSSEGGASEGGASEGGARRWAVVRSMAKSLGPDLRLAALVGDRTTVGRVMGRQLLGPGWVSHLLQRTVASLLADPDLDAMLAVASSTYSERRAALVDVLTTAGIDVHGRSGMNVWVPVADEAAVVAGMQREGFAVRSGARFRAAAAPGVRISTSGTDVATLHSAAEALVAIIGSTHMSAIGVARSG